jgi:hypothetical protein
MARYFGVLRWRLDLIASLTFLADFVVCGIDVVRNRQSGSALLESCWRHVIMFEMKFKEFGFLIKVIMDTPKLKWNDRASLFAPVLPLNLRS